MKEKDFDIAIRDILKDAEESVSPRVWEGVEAAIKPRRLFPVWAWSLTAMAAAAAAALVVFLQAPGKTEHSNPTISIAETPEATVPPIEEQVARNVSLLAQLPEPSVTEVPAAPVREWVPSAVPAEPEEAPAEETLPQEEPRAAIAAVQPDSRPEGAIEDNEALNRLAYSQRKQKEPRGFSFTATGQLQSNTRKELPASIAFRAPGTLPLLAPVVEHGVYDEQPEINFSMPFTLGVGVKYHFNSRLALGTGLRYTYMSRTFLGNYRDTDQGIHIERTDIDNHQHWLGVPLNFYFNLIDSGRWRLNTFVGGTGEFLVNNDYLVHISPKDIHYVQHGNSIQWSVAGGMGVEYRLTPTVGLFVDPSIRYYLGADKQPRSIRTIQPLRIELEAGLRFSFGAQ